MEQSFTFPEIPTSAEELLRLPEATLQSPHQTAALALLALLHFEQDYAACCEMLSALRGPEPMTPYEKSFIKERLQGKAYKVPSFFAGATVENGYTASKPYTITISENAYSFTTENWATVYVKSAGADTPRPIKLRKKLSTGQWFLGGLALVCLSDIRIPATLDPWA